MSPELVPHRRQQLVGEVLLAKELQERGIAVDRGLVVVAADGDADLAGDSLEVLDDAVERPLAAAQRYRYTSRARLQCRI